MIASTKKSMLSQLREMKVADVLTFPLSKMSTIKTCCTMYGAQWDMKFSTSMNRQQKTIDVTRKA